jgi:hypothetical protein
MSAIKEVDSSTEAVEGSLTVVCSAGLIFFFIYQNFSFLYPFGEGGLIDLVASGEERLKTERLLMSRGSILTAGASSPAFVSIDIFYVSLAISCWDSITLFC